MRAFCFEQKIEENPLHNTADQNITARKQSYTMGSKHKPLVLFKNLVILFHFLAKSDFLSKNIFRLKCETPAPFRKYHMINPALELGYKLESHL